MNNIHKEQPMLRTFLKITGLVCMIIAVPLLAARAGEPVKLSWENLVPKAKPIKNPLLSLTNDQAIELNAITYWRSIRAETTDEIDELDKDIIAFRKEIKMEAAQSRKKLITEGVDVDGVLDRFGKWQDELDRRSKLTVKNLDGKQISLAGYLLPLDFSDKGVKEFLLVPYVGACIHTPPPPANQIAFVRLKKAHKINQLYDPVWVTGRMNTKLVSKNLSLVDGSNQIEVGYILNADNISEYVQPK